ncbi:hypothetical protein [Bdellovibrio sp. HCB337]|uniref:hypothetical protein n=1 Tax=Bdellovibrio sp. HCB337 TaxID=3394358 RepID=UPI0039A40077
MRFGARLNPLLTAKIVTLFVALTGFAGSVWAMPAPLCSELWGYEQGAQGRVSKYVHAKTPYSANLLEKHLETIDNLLGPLARPKEAKVTIGSVYTRSVSDFATFEIYVGIRSDVDSAGKIIPPEKNLATLSHEYGHLILEKNLVENLESYRQIKPNFVLVGVARNALRDLTQASKELTARKEATQDPIEKQTLENALQVLTLKMKAISTEADRVQKITNTAMALHEFFSDVVATVRHKDPQAIAYMVTDYQTPAKENSYQELIIRDFSPKDHAAHEKAWEEQRPWASFTNDPYFVMLPSRWEFWQLVKNKINDPNYRSQIIPKVYKAVEKVMSEALTWTPEQIQGVKLTKEQMSLLNQRLIEELKASL